MLTHLPGYASPCRRGTCHIAAITNVGPPTSLVLAHVVRSEDCPVFLGYKGLLTGLQPVGQGISLAQGWIKGIGFPSSDDWADDGPDGSDVFGASRANQHVGPLEHVRFSRNSHPIPAEAGPRCASQDFRKIAMSVENERFCNGRRGTGASVRGGGQQRTPGGDFLRWFW